MKIGLVPCGQRKRDYPCAAQDMYISPSFRAARRYCELACTDWLVITSKYGPVFPEQVIAPYDDYLGKKPRALWREWFERYFMDKFMEMACRKCGNEKPVFWSALPLPFRIFLIPELLKRGFEVEQPLLGLTIFRQNGRLHQIANEAAARHRNSLNLCIIDEGGK